MWVVTATPFHILQLLCFYRSPDSMDHLIYLFLCHNVKHVCPVLKAHLNSNGSAMKLQWTGHITQIREYNFYGVIY